MGARLHWQYGKQVLFTEIGYCSGHCSRTHTPSGADYATQAQHYEAVFEAFRNVSVLAAEHGNDGDNGPTNSRSRSSRWFLGSFWWNWNTDDGRYSSGSDDCLTPQHKPAEAVLRKYYRATKPAPRWEENTTSALCMGAAACTC